MQELVWRRLILTRQCLRWRAQSFSPANRWTSGPPMRLPFHSQMAHSTLPSVCQFGVMFFPNKDRSYHEVHRVFVPGSRYLFSVCDSHRHNPFARLAHEVAGSFFPDDPPQFYGVPF